MKIKCDMCSKKKSVPNNIEHFTGYVKGKYCSHWHICKKCRKKNSIKSDTVLVK